MTAVVVSGYTVGLSVARALGRMGVPVVVLHYDQRDIAQVSRYATASFDVPHPEHAERRFLEALERLGTQFPGAVLFPATDEALVTVSRHKERLSGQYRVACSDWSVTSRLIEKQDTYAVAAAAGVPAPATLTPRSLEEAAAYGATVAFPILVKPSQGHRFYERFKQKMIRVGDVAEMLAVYRAAADAGLEVMLQELIPGDDEQVVNYNAYAADGEVLVEFTADHIRSAPPLLGSPRVARSRHIPEVIEPGRRLLRAFGFSGYACTEFKRDPRDGVYKLMEVNGRHNLSTALAVHCGINFPWLHYLHLVLGLRPQGSAYRCGVYWIDLERDVAYSAKCLRVERYTLGQYLRPYFSPHVFASLDWKDPLPFLKRGWFLLRTAVLGSLAALRPVATRARALEARS
ncbi:MAG TPA: hypothetical protein VFX28_15450 [Methylomirabilota bacterium]|nr:hypothetical protein [Methylomirabilota bacterium]